MALKSFSLVLVLGIFAMQAVMTPSIAGAATVAASAAVAKDCADCPEMVAIPAGRFVMGAAPGEEANENLAAPFLRRSQPPRAVEVAAFAIGKHEVTRGQYRVFAEATGRRSDGCFNWSGSAFEMDARRDWRNPGYAQDDSHPVTCVSWDDASAYAQWLAAKTGRRYRLPSEAEWEYAARAGTTAARFWGDDGNQSCDYANAADQTAALQIPGAAGWTRADCNDRHAYTAPVGSYGANAFGLHDMLGNVAEWTQDCWNGSYESAPANSHARISGDCSLRVVRGGSWEDAPVGVRAAYRVGSPAVIRVYTRGFRVGIGD
jgi:formylglycine-generating enzyme required for sulfatase activity